ncbi:Methionyl-tRNA formyltransferase, mitochondrial [Portunus trituberculatus]|uniref:Methionyl-tRNA formyltransferase, mitochondrial n=2 Tax=Portunus trituberculatus TaxID=210409 RepID=A0A5B7F6X8_PORTR|nr:Methionyl-tRNA formyltransferase, mitochondrial [Portunus trituberculatus]
MGWSILQSFSKRQFQASWSLPLATVARKFCSEFNLAKCITLNQKPPPWKVMFFGTDDFSLKSLEVLHMELMKGGLIKRLDVVSVPLKKSLTVVRHFCQKEGLQITDWPVTVPQGVYDVGIVASFGHLIPASVINAFPM